ncbi:nitroreductase family protein [Mucilaginibacter paludis]|uniref:Putative NAD(P)H nitroreductase n=1 Tax=Mucilaginibacter paludis DSM 18603 TaxID=714943 RepID=H1YDN8_9SPHI|nr:nitroreductase [Mucilaginibacter paludis]EHQ30727.1 nitroreductase [Mucilaginibacter paludis DSM 18603]
MSEIFDTLSSVIKNRRTTKPPEMNGKKIPDEVITQLLELADWAPTHANTEPWKFVVYTNGKEFGKQHAELYKANTPDDQYMQMTYEKLLHMPDKASHVIVSTMQRKPTTRIPVLEEIAATACAMQNILLGATALGIASYWGSGGMVHSRAMKTFLALGDEDIVMGVLYLGYSDHQPTGKRNIPLSEKVKWV